MSESTCTPIRCQTCKRATDDPAHVHGCACKCSVSQSGDREWFCATHRRNAEDCAGGTVPERTEGLADYGPHEHVFRCQDCGEIRA